MMDSASPRERWCRARRLAGLWLAACVLTAGWLDAPSAAGQSILLRDFDRDGLEERLLIRDGGSEIERWDPENAAWEKADFGLPEGVALTDDPGRDTGLRFLDLNGDGFDDVLFSNARRFAIHLWTTDVQPHLGWVRGWSQFVRVGERTGSDGEPPNLEGTDVHTEAGDLLVRPLGKASGPAMASRFRLAALIAFDTPPPLAPDEALASMRVPPGFRVELVAAEPVVVDPIAFDWDAEGRLWVVEMRDYPTGMDGKGKPGGVVKVLHDRDGDGRYESMTPFLEGIPFPTSVMPWRGGALVAMAPDLVFAEDTDGDGRADRQRVVLTGFVPGNQQHRFNGFEWGLDGWVYAANGDSGGEIRVPGSDVSVSIRGRDFRFRPDTGEFETVSAQTQYGRRRDDWGNWFGNNNPTWLWHVTVPEHYLRRNPRVAVKRVLHVLANYDDSTRVFPVSRAMVRPNQPWSLNHVTSACSPSPYRDVGFGAEFETSVFIGEPVHNAVHREVVERDGSGLVSRRAVSEAASEFLASTDNWCRPTTVRTGPDGALYVADMYRFVIEHPEWISPEMQSRLDLRAGEDRGRLYRVVKVDQGRRPIPNLARLNEAELVSAMDSPSGWQRDMVQRLILERHPTRPSALAPASAIPSSALPRFSERQFQEISERLASLLSVTHRPQVRLQALATLGTMGTLAAGQVIAALRDPSPWVRMEALRQSEAFPGKSGASDVFQAVSRLAGDADAAVRVQVAFSLGAWPENAAEPILKGLAADGSSDELLRTAILTSLRPESEWFSRMNSGDPVPKEAARVPPLNPTSDDRAAVIAQYRGVEALEGDAARGRSLFINLCAPCHRLRGEGYEVGADLGMVGAKPVDWLLLAILDPSQAVDARYQAWHLTLQSGDELDGLVAAETANNLVIRMAGGVDHPVLRDDIKAMESLRVSLMPEGFESALTPQGMADLVRWLRGN